AASPGGQPMRFRIGVNLGDVMVEGSDIYGDGVNIAARLQELAEPGGVVISGPVYDQVRNKLSVGFDYLGEQEVKNVAPVVSYRVTVGGRPGAGAAAPGPDRPPPAVPQAPREPATGVMAALDWFARLPRSVSTPLAIAAFLFLINVFTGISRPW